MAKLKCSGHIHPGTVEIDGMTGRHNDIVSPSFVDPARESMTVLSQENIPLPFSISIKPPTIHEQSKPMPQYNMRSSNILSNISHRMPFLASQDCFLC
jgi:hypothetical protein